MLPEVDEAYLKDGGFNYTLTELTQAQNVETLLVIVDYELPASYSPRHVDLLIRLLPGYPKTPPDMFWTTPGVTLTSNGAAPQAAEPLEEYAGRKWQRWSRHFDATKWRQMVDGVETYLRAIKTELARGR
jgi:hypothetical protein